MEISTIRVCPVGKVLQPRIHPETGYRCGDGHRNKDQEDHLGRKHPGDAESRSAQHLPDPDFLDAHAGRVYGKAQQTQAGNGNGQRGGHLEKTFEIEFLFVLGLKILVQEAVIEGISWEEIVPSLAGRGNEMPRIAARIPDGNDVDRVAQAEDDGLDVFLQAVLVIVLQYPDHFTVFAGSAEPFSKSDAWIRPAEHSCSSLVDDQVILVSRQVIPDPPPGADPGF